MSIPGSISKVKRGVRISVHAKPSAKTSAITEITDTAVGVSIAAPPTDNKANEKLVEFIASVLGVKRRQVEFESGGKSRNKALLVTDMEVEEVYNKLKQERNL